MLAIRDAVIVSTSGLQHANVGVDDLVQRAVIADPGIVDQNVEPAEAICYRRSHRLPVRCRGDITGHRDGIELTGQPLKAATVTASTQ